jgi:oxygen-independent coproporphyrinogen-3 oxidase
MPETSTPLSLYVHVPWCARKCPYCDFNSHEARGGIPQDEYVRALLADLEFELAQADGRRIETVFIGGGTPSLFSPRAIAALLTGIRSRADLAPEAEITLEANPGSSEAAKFAGFREAGVNRLSVGVQSFQPGLLPAIGRIHDADEARGAARAARAAGFDNVNLDLMFALPGQTLRDVNADLDAAFALDPMHLSFYQLTIEPKTAFGRRPPPLPDEDAAFEMQEAVRGRLEGGGYAQYEVSAYARAGARCRHNLNYWEFGDYLGIGAGAHGKLTRNTGITRRWRLKSPGRYLAGAGSKACVGGEEDLDAGTVRTDFLMNALRLNEGFEEALLTARTGLTLASLEPALSEVVDAGLLLRVGGRVGATDRGRRFLNELLIRLIPTSNAPRALAV